MAYARWVKQGKKVYGPYFYDTVEADDGTKKTVYLGTDPPRISQEPDPISVTPERETSMPEIGATALVIVFILLFGYLGFTGYITGIETHNTMGPDKVFAESGSHSFEMEVPGNLTSLSISGTIVGNGSVRVYLLKSDGMFLVLDSDSLAGPDSPEAGLSITGHLVDEAPSNETPTEDIYINTTSPPSDESTNETAEVENKSIEDETPETADSAPLNETSDEQSTPNESLSIVSDNESSIALPENLTAEQEPPTQPMNETNLNETLNQTPPSESNLTQNLTAPENITNMTTQDNQTNITTPVYNETNLTQINETAPLQNITNETIPEPQTNFTKRTLKFQDVCIDTCSLEPEYHDEITLLVELDPKTKLRVKNITYSVREDYSNLPPEGQVPNQTMGTNSTLTMDLDEFFTDPEGEPLKYTPKSKELHVEVNGSILWITSGNETGDFRIWVKAKDAGKKNLKYMFYVNVTNHTETKKITLEKEGEVDKILRCAEFDEASGACSAWEFTDIDFEDNGENITFVPEDPLSVYMGSDIPVVSSDDNLTGNWTIRFNYSGTNLQVVYTFNISDYNAEAQPDDSTIYFRQKAEEPVREIPVDDGSVVPRTIAKMYLDKHPIRFKSTSARLVSPVGEEALTIDALGGKMVLTVESPPGGFDPGATIDMAVSPAPQIVEEISGKRSMNAKHFRTTDEDVFKATFFTGPVHYTDNSGNIKDFNPMWEFREDRFYSMLDVYQAEVTNRSVFVERVAGNDTGKTASWNPQVFLDGQEINPVSENATLLSEYPQETIFENNALEWDYGICKRILRLDQGSIIEIYVLESDPGGNLTIKSNWDGNLTPSDYYAIDADGDDLYGFEVVGDEKRVPAATLSRVTYPVEIDDSLLEESSSYDGVVFNESDSSEGYSYTHDAATGTANSATTNILMRNTYTDTTGYGDYEYWVYRGFLDFDTSSMGAGASVSSAILSLYGQSKTEGNSGYSTLHVVEGAQNLPLQNNDYGDHLSKTTSAGSIAYSSYSITAYNNITLDSTGRGWINPTGTTKFCTRLSSDKDDDAPTGDNFIGFWSYEGSFRPKLYVTYTPLGGEGDPCTYGDDCSSNICVEGACRSSCASYPGVRCSNDGSNAYTSDGQCLSAGTCDDSSPVRMDCGATGTSSCQVGTDSTYDTCTSSSGDSCDTTTAGNFSQTGTCTSSGCTTSGVIGFSSPTYYAGCTDLYACDSSYTGGDYSRDGTCINTECCDTSEGGGQVAYGTGQEDTTPDEYCSATPTTGRTCDDDPSDGISLEGITSGTDDCCASGYTYGSSATDATPWETCSGTCTAGRTCADMSNIASGIAETEEGLCVNEGTCETGDVCYTGAIYYSTMGSCSSGNGCDTDINSGGNGYSRDGYVCSTCVQDGSVANGGSCCAIDALCSDATYPSSCRAADSKCGYDNGQPCSTGDQCDSDLCVGGTCVASCDTQSGYGCSDDATAWNNAAAGTCYDSTPSAAGGTYGCDDSNEFRMDCGGSGTSACQIDTDASYDSCDTSSGDSCDFDAGGNFGQNGICAAGATYNCNTAGFVCKSSGGTYYADESAVGNCAADDECDNTLTVGDFSAGNYRYNYRTSSNTMDNGYSTSTSDDNCCSTTGYCVNSGICYSNGDTSTDVDSDGDNDFCSGGTWYDCSISAQCGGGEACNASNDCEAGAPGDYTCGTCDECTEYINNGSLSSGGSLTLTVDITGYAGADDSSEIGESCIKFDGADNIIFDCDGFTISGDGDNYGYGVWLNETNDGSDNNTIKDCTNISYFSRGIRIEGSSGNTEYNTIQNATLIRNYYGVYLGYSRYGTVTNVSFEDNTYIDLAVNGLAADCWQTFDNVTGSGGRPIGYYNTTSVIEDQIFSQLILCDADDSTVDNVTIISSDSVTNNDLRLVRTTGAKLTNINSSYVEYGIYLASGSDNNILENITVNYDAAGIYVPSADGNTFTNITSIGSANGIRLYSSSHDNVINDSTFTDNTGAGIWIDEYSSNSPYDNLIYNNYFNNSGTYGNRRFDATVDTANYWNVTRDCSKTNIIGGPCVGGNYWTNGTDFSDTCTDSNKDGICDSVFNFFTNNNDSLALTYGWGTLCDSCDDCSTKIAAASPGEIVALSTNIIGYAGADDSSEIGESCIRFDGADNVIFNCGGYTISGDGDSYGHGIWLNESDAGTDNNIIMNCDNISYFDRGIRIDGSAGSTENNTIQNSVFTRNNYGVASHSAIYGTFTNITSEESIIYDVWVVGRCQQTFDNITGSGGRGIGFYNETSIIEDQIFSELILCDADDSTVDNVTIMGSDSRGNNVLSVTSTSGATLTNINSSYNYEGIRLSWTSDNNIFENMDLSYSVRGVYVVSCDGNNFTNITAIGNAYGIDLYDDSHDNMINDSNFTDNTAAAIFLDEYLGDRPYDNLIYNNYFNNSGTYGNLRFDASADLANQWNTTKDCSGEANILGGPCIGGNYWANNTGTEFSQTCSDTNGDGICDSVYTLYTNNYDNLSLTYTPPTILLTSPSPGATESGNGLGFVFNVSSWLPGNYNCTLYLDNGTTFSGGMNDSTLNDTSTTIISTNLIDDTYTWWVNCTDSQGIQNHSEIRSLTIDIFPLIWFDELTPANNTYQTQPWAEIYVNITEDSMEDLLYNWDGTNYTIYNDSLMLMMNFDNLSALGENNTYVADLSPQGNDATCNSGSGQCPSWTSSGRHQGAFNFAGDNDFFTITDDDSLSFGDGSDDYPFSVSAWIKMDDATDFPIMVKGRYVDGSPADTREWWFQVNWQDKLAFVFYDESVSNGNEGRLYSGDMSTYEGEWIHVAGTYNGTGGEGTARAGVDIYLNGEVVDDTDESGSGTYDSMENRDGVLYIAAVELGFGFQYSDGIIDDIRVYNRELSSDEIKMLYMSNLWKYDTDEWQLYVNQTKDETDLLDDGAYTYQAFASDTSSKQNQTEQRTITIDNIEPMINLEYPDDSATNTTDSTPDFIFNMTDSLSYSASCELFLFNDTTLGYGTNTTTWNDTSTTITANTTQIDDTYTWWISCTDQAGNTNTSVNRTLTISIIEYTCNDCDSCTNYINNGTLTAWDTLRLTADITGYAGADDSSEMGESCIKFDGADNIIFDCDGFTISGDSDNYGYGVWLNETNSGSDNNIIKDCTNISYFGRGIRIEGSSGNTENNTIQNSTTFRNQYGIYLVNSRYGTLTNVTSEENTVWDLQVNGVASDCWQTFDNVTGSGGREIGYYNETSLIEDKIFSELILCDADDSTVDNVTIISSDSIRNNCIMVARTSGATFTNINSSYVYDGIYLYSASGSNILEDITVNNNVRSGIYLTSEVGSNLTNITSIGNAYGIILYSNARDNIINDSRFTDNSNTGIFFNDWAVVNRPYDNLIYNNIFDNSGTNGNLLFDTYSNRTNYWNVTRDCSKANILGGPCIGGNYWANDSSTEFSQTCSDTDGDGICDSVYSLYLNNTDNLSLTYTPPTIFLTSPSPGASTSDTTPDFVFNVSSWVSGNYNCTVYADNGTTYVAGNNDTTLNDTSTTITSTITLAEDTYTWYVNCTNSQGVENQSETRSLTIDINEYTCNTCNTCTAAVDSASSGETVRLTADIIGYAGADDSSEIGESCVKFDGADDIIFDCDGFTISGDGDAYGYGVWLNETNDGSDNNIITNCTNISYFERGIRIDGSAGNSENNTIQNTTATKNSYGVFLQDSSYGILIDVTLEENVVFDFHISTNCLQTLSNVIGSGGGPIGFYNETSIIEDQIFSELSLCDADGSTVDNITIIGSDSRKNNVVHMLYTSGATLTNINSSYNYDGFYMGSGNDNNIFENVTVNYNNRAGIWMAAADGNNLTNITVTGNNYGIRLYRDSHDNIINDSRFTDNTGEGIWFDEESGQAPYDNLIYNNYFNNSGTYGNIRFDATADLANYWNVTRDCSKTNIIGGPCIGGNLWGNGTDFSDTCSDTDGDGICDSVFTFFTNNNDSLSLTYTPPTIQLTSPSPGASTEDQTPDFVFNVSSWISSTYNCSLYLDNGTTYQAGMNDTTLNGTSTTITSTLLAEDTYTWWVNCTNSQGRQNQSETRSLTVDVNEYTCNTCADCTTKVSQASSGETVRITADLDSAGSSCINLNGNDGIILDCEGKTIYNSNPGSSDYGIYSDAASGANNTMIKDCSNISYFQYGIYVRYTNNITIYNTSLFENTAGVGSGIYIRDTEHSNITHINSSDNGYGFYIYSSHNNTLTNITSNNNDHFGIYTYLSNNNTLTNITVNYNAYNGIYLQTSNNNTLRNVTITTTGNQGGLLTAMSVSTIYRNDIDNTVTVDGKPVQYFDGYYKVCPNNQVLDYNNTYSQVAFVDCDNVTLKNSTITDSVYLIYTNNSNVYDINSSYNYYGIRLTFSNNNTLTNITTNYNNQEGILITSYSNNNTLTNITANYNDDDGIGLSGSNNTLTDITANSNTYGLSLNSANNNTLTDITANSNSAYGIYLTSNADSNIFTNITANYNTNRGFYIRDSSNNTLTNVTASSSQYGILLYEDSDYNNISSSYIQNNSYGGIWFDENTDAPEYNVFWNNYFNNSGTYGNVRIDLLIFKPNYFNVTRDCSGEANILGGSCIAGNYWTSPTKDNFSDTCPDTNGDGICDTDYQPSGSHSWYDYEPLTYTPPTIQLTSPADDAINTTDRTPGFTFNVSSWVSGNYNCTLYLDNGTTFSAGMNDTTLNDTSTTIASTVILVDDDYDWWVNCTNSGGRENQSEVLNLSIVVPIFVEEITVLPDVTWTNTTLSCRFNVTHSDPNANITANITWWRWNQSGSLLNFSLVDHTVNVTQGAYNYSIQNVTWNYTNHNESWFCSVRLCDDTQCYDWSSSANRTIQEYGTYLTVDSVTSSPVQNQMVDIYANYTSYYPRFGLGLNRTEIGRVIWNTSDLDNADDARSIAFFDCENKGKRDCIVLGTQQSEGLRAFYSNGTELSGNWPGEEAEDHIHEIDVGDLDNDGYYNDIVIAEAGNSLRVFNESGDEVWSYGGLDQVNSVVITDLDNDGIKDDFAAGVSVTSSYKVMAFNTSDGKEWTNFWNGSNDFSEDIREVAVGDFDSDGDDDVVAVDYSGGTITTFIGDNGTMIFNTTDLGTLSSVAAIDLDHDGFKDEVIAGGNGQLLAYEWNGTWGVEFNDTEYIWSQSDPSNDILELEIADLDGDGFEDDIVAGDVGYIWGIANDSTQLWNFTDSGFAGNTFSISIDDINDDGLTEITAGGIDDTIWVLDRTGELVFESEIGLGDIGAASGSSPATGISDINNDGIYDIAVSSGNGYAHILQSVNCTARFNDSSSVYSASWNDTARLWQANRTFSSTGDYAYNITCQKGGYEQDFVSGELSIGSDDIPMLVSLESPVNNTMNTTDNTPDFTFNVTDNPYDTFTCSLYTNRTDTGTGTPILRASNTSTHNNTSTTLAPSTGLADGYHDWWVNCTDGYTTNQSDIWNISIQVSDHICNSCSECTVKIASASSGDRVRVIADLTAGTDDTEIGETCISFGGTDNITLECDGHSIEGDGDSTGYGIWLNDSGSGSNNNTVMGCTNISYFDNAVYLYYSDENNLTNTTASEYSDQGIYLYYSDNNNISNATLTGGTRGIWIRESDNNKITNVNTSYNTRGLHFTVESQYNNINSSYIHDNSQYGIYLHSSGSNYPTYNTFYNNYLNNTVNLYSDNDNNENYWNVTKDCSGEANTIGGSCTGGNYWTDPDGNFSDSCPDTDSDGICDSTYTPAMNNTDWLVLTYTPPTISLTSPDSGTSTDDTTPDFTFNVSSWVSGNYNCTVYVDNGTTYLAGMNDTTLNDTSTTITSTILVDGTYTWWVNCTNSGGRQNQSDVWSLIISTMKLNITRAFRPHPIFAGENETVTVNTTLQVNQTSNDVVQVNITDQIPWDFTAPQASEVTVYFVDDSGGTSTDITTNSTVSISVSDQSGSLPTLLMVNITNISETDADGYLEENDSILLVYTMITSQMEAEGYRLVYTNASVTDNTSQKKSDWLLSNITASEVLLRGWKYIWHPDLSNPQDMSVIIEFTSMGGPTSGIYIADYLPQGAEVNDLNVSLYNSSLGSWVDLVNGSDYYISLDNPGQSTLPDGVHVDIYHYNLSYAFTNWDGNLYDNDTIRITYNITVLGGGEWILPAIIAGFDPEYQKHIKTEMYASANVPSFDVLLEILTDSVDRGGVVKALLRILNVGGPKAKVDVFVTYAAKTLQGEMLSERSETLAVVEQKERSLELTLPEDIEPGTYIFESFVSYTGREAMSTGTFIVRGDGEGQGIMEYSLYIFLALIVLVLIMMYLRVARKKGSSRPSILVVMLLLAMLLAPLVSGQSITGSLEVIDRELDPGDELKTLFKLRNSRFDGYRTEVLITYSLYDPTGTLMKSEAGTYPVSDSRDILFKTIIPKDSAPGEYSLSAEIDYDEGGNTYIDGFIVAGEESPIMLYLITLPLIGAVLGVIFTTRRKG